MPEPVLYSVIKIPCTYKCEILSLYHCSAEYKKEYLFCLFINYNYCVNTGDEAVQLSQDTNNFFTNMFDFSHLLYKIMHFPLFRNFAPKCNKSMYFQIPFTNIPLKLEVPQVRTVASGLRHSAILTTDGLVMVCGSGRNGQLGLTDNGIPIAEVEQPQEST